MERGRLAAHVMAHRVDLIARHVEAVAALVLEQQVVALDAIDRLLHHSGVATDAVLVVDDVVAGLQVLEEADRVARARTARTVSAAATREIGLGEYGERNLVEDEAALDR